MKSATLHKIGFYIILFLTVIFPVFFLPITSEFYEFNKNFLLITTSGILLLLLTVGFVVDKQVKITRSPFGLPILAVLVTWLISTIARTPNPFDAILNPNQTGAIVALAIYYFTATNFIRTKRELDLLVAGLVGSFSLLAFSSILWGTGIMENIAPWAFAKASVWTPTGNPLMTLSMLIILLPFLGILIAKQKENSNRMLVLSIALFLFVAASGITTYRIFQSPSNRPIFLSQSVSWSIAMEALKISPLIGTGADTYLTDFTRFRPVSYNMTDSWNIRFNSASNYYLQILTTIGLLGLAAITFLFIRVVSMLIRSLRSSSDASAHTTALTASVTAVILMASFFVVPPGTVSLFLLFTLLIMVVSAFKLMGSPLVHDANIDIVAASDSGIRTPILPIISFALSLALVIIYGPTLAKAYYAEVAFQQGLVAVGKNDGKTAFERINTAIRLNPFKDGYRTAASQTYLLLANSAATKKDLTAEDRDTITKLVQQSIQEAKNAVSLNPTKATNLVMLANVYQNLVNFAQGADQWAVASYQQAINLDPTNPELYVSLGGIYYARGNYDEALRLFLLAADRKPNYANAFYNISAVYKQKKDYQNAYIAMQQVINIVDKTSADYIKAKGEMDELGKLIGSAAQVPAQPEKTELETAKPIPSPKVNPPIALPSELGPETPAATPTPSAAPSVSPAAPSPTTAP
ncbi:MAG: tetratricopeptide repeat protein [Patescibacteria group bacterium]